MAVYETGTATDVNDLLSKLRTFAVANGWTENNFGTRTTGTGNALQINKGGSYVTFRTDNAAGTTADPSPRMGCYAHDTYSGGNGTELQANASAFCMANGMPGPFTAYHFISGTERGAEYLYVIVEVAAGIFKHFGTGTLMKMGAITSGQFVFGSTWNYTVSILDQKDDQRHNVPFDTHETSALRSRPGGNFRVDAESITWRWMDCSANPTTATRGMRGGFRTVSGGSSSGGLNVMFSYAASLLTGRNMFFPCFLLGERTGGLLNPLGAPPGVRFANLTSLEPNQVVTIGSDNWKVFPLIRKNGGVGQVNSGVYGYAYKVN